MDVITRSLFAPADAAWSSVHRIVGCYGCIYARREKLGCGSCCTHPRGMLVDLSLKCLRRKERQPVSPAVGGKG